MNTVEIQYVANEQGKPTAVIVPIELWQQILAEQETKILKLIKEIQRTPFTGTGQPEA